MIDAVSLHFLQEIAEYDDEFGLFLQGADGERVCKEIAALRQQLDEKDTAHSETLERMLTDIRQSRQKIVQQQEEIRARVESYDISHAEYEEIMADTDNARQEKHLGRFLEERIKEIQSSLLSSGNFDKVVHGLWTPEQMLEMRKDLYVDGKNIVEALSLTLIENRDVQKIIRSMIETRLAADENGSKDTLQQQGAAAEQGASAMGDLFERASRNALRMSLFIEQYQREGLSEIRHLEELDRRVVYMLTTLALKKNK